MALAPTRLIPAAKSPPATQGANYFPQLAVNHGAIWDRLFDWLNAVAGANAITADTEGPDVDDYARGMGFWFIPAAVNTGAVTIDINSAGAKDLRDADGALLKAGDLLPGKAYGIIYTGVHFRVVIAGNRRLAEPAELLAGAGEGLLDATRGKALLDAFAPSAAAEYITEWTRTATVTSVVFNNLGEYRNLYLVGDARPTTAGSSSGGSMSIDVSPDNGSTWRNGVAIPTPSTAGARDPVVCFLYGFKEARQTRSTAWGNALFALDRIATNVEAHSALRLRASSGTSAGFASGSFVLLGDK
jgi:hypothetical protein